VIVRLRTAAVNAVRGLAKPCGYRLPASSTLCFAKRCMAALPPGLAHATRPYTTAGGFFRAVSPKRTVFEGGPGAWEAVLRYSHIDLDSKNVSGGTFDRITPQVNWYLSENVRLEFNYGYGHLDRFGLNGNTNSSQTGTANGSSRVWHLG